MNNATESAPSWWRGLVAPLSLSAILLFGSAGYLYWKSLHPDAEKWAPGDVGSMLATLSVADVGQFVSGVAGALVFIWIIFTYSAQREELALQRWELQAQRKEFEKLASEAHAQSELLEETSRTNKRDAFIRLLALREREMALTTAELLRIMAPSRVELDNVRALWDDYKGGERHVFFRALIARVVRGKHQQFMDRIGEVMGARETLEFIMAQAQTTLEDADELDRHVGELCHNTPWAMMAVALKFLLSGQAEGVEELPLELVGH